MSKVNCIHVYFPRKISLEKFWLLEFTDLGSSHLNFSHKCDDLLVQKDETGRHAAPNDMAAHT